MRREPTRFRPAGNWRLALGALTLALTVAVPAWPANSFYTDLLRDGQRAYQRGDFTAAARDLRIACFGLLDEPEPLMQGLVALALAQAGGGQAEAFQHTFDRLLEVEERFAVYLSAPIPDPLRTAFEEETARRVPLATLRTTPAFERLAQRAGAGVAEDLSPAQRRQQLEAQLVAAPGDSGFLLQLAELELEQGRARRATSNLDKILAAEPQNAMARCLRGRVAARSQDCRRAVVDLPACDQPADPTLAAERLGCLVRLKQWPQADGLLATLPENVRTDSKIASLEQRVRRALPAGTRPAISEPTSSQPAGPKPADSATNRPGAPTESPSAAGGVTPAEPATALAQLERRLEEIESTDQLDRLLDDARLLAAAYPASQAVQFVAAEIAYRASSWSDVLAFLERTDGPPPDNGALQFYFAVSLYETGRPQAATEPMRRALAGIERTPFVDSYARKILGANAGAS